MTPAKISAASISPTWGACQRSGDSCNDNFWKGWTFRTRSVCKMSHYASSVGNQRKDQDNCSWPHNLAIAIEVRRKNIHGCMQIKTNIRQQTLGSPHTPACSIFSTWGREGMASETAKASQTPLCRTVWSSMGRAHIALVEINRACKVRAQHIKLMIFLAHAVSPAIWNASSGMAPDRPPYVKRLFMRSASGMAPDRPLSQTPLLAFCFWNGADQGPKWDHATSMCLNMPEPSMVGMTWRIPVAQLWFPLLAKVSLAQQICAIMNWLPRFSVHVALFFARVRVYALQKNMCWELGSRCVHPISLALVRNSWYAFHSGPEVMSLRKTSSGSTLMNQRSDAYSKWSCCVLLSARSPCVILQSHAAPILNKQNSTCMYTHTHT